MMQSLLALCFLGAYVTADSLNEKFIRKFLEKPEESRKELLDDLDIGYVFPFGAPLHASECYDESSSDQCVKKWMDWIHTSDGQKLIGKFRSDNLRSPEVSEATQALEMAKTNRLMIEKRAESLGVQNVVDEANGMSNPMSCRFIEHILLPALFQSRTCTEIIHEAGGCDQDVMGSLAACTARCEFEVEKRKAKICTTSNAQGMSEMGTQTIRRRTSEMNTQTTEIGTQTIGNQCGEQAQPMILMLSVLQGEMSSRQYLEKSHGPEMLEQIRDPNNEEHVEQEIKNIEATVKETKEEICSNDGSVKEIEVVHNCAFLGDIVMPAATAMSCEQQVDKHGDSSACGQNKAECLNSCKKEVEKLKANICNAQGTSSIGKQSIDCKKGSRAWNFGLHISVMQDEMTLDAAVQKYANHLAIHMGEEVPQDFMDGLQKEIKATVKETKEEICSNDGSVQEIVEVLHPAPKVILP
jgi:hypothetical protein